MNVVLFLYRKLFSFRPSFVPPTVAPNPGDATGWPQLSSELTDCGATQFVEAVTNQNLLGKSRRTVNPVTRSRQEVAIR